MQVRGVSACVSVMLLAEHLVQNARKCQKIWGKGPPLTENTNALFQRQMQLQDWSLIYGHSLRFDALKSWMFDFIAISHLPSSPKSDLLIETGSILGIDPSYAHW